MKNFNEQSKSHQPVPGRAPAGFTLVELLVAMAVFMIVTGAALSLFSQHQPMFNQQQNLAGLNIAMRNATAQMQVDIANGGAGYYNGVNIPNWPVGVVISNNVVTSTGDCHAGTTYGANCFDSFVVIVADDTTTPVNPLAGASGSLPVVAGTCAATTTDTSATTSIYVLPPTGVAAATYAGNFFNGDQILLVKGDGSKYTTVELTANGSTQVVSGTTYVLLTHGTKTNANGSNAASDDETGMSVNSADLTTSQFCATDWVVRLAPIKYDVDISTASDPKLRRTVLVKGQTPAANGVTLTEQVIGFKVGAALFNGATDTTTYNFDSSTFISASSPGGFDYTLVRSVMISLVGRTPPVTDPTYVFRNSFDSGPYEIQGVSVVVNPRNMSMTD
jgi:prepilin-type N-terminal cleavage/methylation domain-containing protein